MNNLQNLVSKKNVVGINEVKFDKDRLCSSCEAGKITKKHHSAKTIMTTTRPLELLYMDLFSPQNYASLGGNKYGLVIVDDFSRYTWVFFLDDKRKVVDIFKTFAKRAQTEYEVSLSISEVIMVQNSRIQTSMIFLMPMVLHMNSLLHIHRNKMVLLKEIIILLLKCPELCLLNTRHLYGSGMKLSIQHVISSTRFI